MNVAGAPAALKRQESKLDDNWDYKEDRRVYEEETTATELHLAVGKIADAIVSTVTTMASGGAFTPFLLKSLRGAVVNAGWSATDQRDKLIKKEFGNNVCLYIEIDKMTRSTEKKLMGSTRKSLVLKADTKFLMMTALNAAAKRELKQMKDNQAKDKLKYIKKTPGWSQEGREDANLQQQQNESVCAICTVDGMCVIL